MRTRLGNGHLFGKQVLRTPALGVAGMPTLAVGNCNSLGDCIGLGDQWPGGAWRARVLVTALPQCHVLGERLGAQRQFLVNGWDPQSLERSW